ncbi:MAG TPA: HAMP domain-containing sensor histidine kinase, partial [Candidatus Thermoplasmatota archaeon]|nr:HAMP domain-containing sensor histidine kinase [Candidatus Thermoplasmatota archaeon]
MTLLFALWVDREWGGADATLWMVDLVSLAAPLAAAGACWHRARRDEGHRRQAWRLVAIGCLSWALGQVVWAWYELARGLEVPNPSLADLGYLAFIPAMAAALVMAVAGTVAAVSRIRTLLDGAILAGSILFLGWAGGFGSEFQAGEGTLIARSVNLVYPVGDVALLVLAAYGLYRAHPGGRLPVLLQTAGIFAIFNADNQFLDENLAGTYATGSILDAGWVAGFLLFGLSALVPGTPAAPEFTRLRQSGSLVIYIPLAAAIATAAAIEVTRGSLEPFLFWNALVVVVLVVARGSLVFAENVSLTQQVEEAYARLKVLEAQRSMLLRTVTHDLQNPLSPIQIQLHLLAKTDPTPAQRRGLDIIGRSAEQMKRLTDDLLDLARIEDARLNLDRRRLDLKELLETQAASYADAAQSRGLRLRLDVSAALPVQADSGRL